MLQRHEPYSFLPAPFGIALCGLLFCAWNAWSIDSMPCLSAGCTLFRNFTIAGISLWWVGVAGFAVLFLCALLGRLSLGRFCAASGLVLDCLLLLAMLGTAPCLTCLAAALLLALTYLFFLQAAHTRLRTFSGLKFSVLLAVWACLFISNLGGLARESASPWAMQEAANAQDLIARAYVSPSCPACRQLVLELPPDQAQKIAWFPVAEQEQDLRVIGAMLDRLRRGETLAQALPAALEEPLSGTWSLLRPDMLLLRLRLWRNQNHVLENGKTLPLIEFSGLPSFMLQQRRAASSSAPAPKPTPRPTGQDPNLPAELDVIGRCGASSGTPCP